MPRPVPREPCVRRCSRWGLAAVQVTGWSGRWVDQSVRAELHTGAFWYRGGMAMTLRLPAELEAELKLAADEDRRSVQQTVLLAVEMFLAARETAEVKA